MKNLRMMFVGSGIAIAMLATAAMLPAAPQGGAETTYKTKCAACHSADGSGNSPTGKAMGVHDFRSPDVQKMTDDELAQIITNGKGKMPAYGKQLKDTDIKGLVAYIRSLAKK
ncbi:MAG: c-type cytochrome [Candidatus Acidiferrales bacterium]